MDNIFGRNRLLIKKTRQIFFSKSFIISHDQFHVRAAMDTEKDNHGTKQPVEAQPAKGRYVSIFFYFSEHF